MFRGDGEMIISYKMNNFCSFAEPAEFEMMAPNNKVKNRLSDLSIFSISFILNNRGLVCSLGIIYCIFFV